MNPALFLMALGVVFVPTAQREMLPSGIQFGTVRIHAVGDTGREKFSADQGSETFRQETMDAEFDLTFGMDKSGKSTATISATNFDHKIIYEREMTTVDGSFKTTTESKMDPKKDVINLAATISIVMESNQRRLRFSYSEPYVAVTGGTTTTGAYGAGAQKPSTSPLSSKQERLFLDLDWSKAHWSSGYNGSLAMVSDKYYIDPCTKKPWILVRMEWSLHPFAS